MLVPIGQFQHDTEESNADWSVKDAL